MRGRDEFTVPGPVCLVSEPVNDLVGVDTLDPNLAALDPTGDQAVCLGLPFEEAGLLIAKAISTHDLAHRHGPQSRRLRLAGQLAPQRSHEVGRDLGVVRRVSDLGLVHDLLSDVPQSPEVFEYSFLFKAHIRTSISQAGRRRKPGGAKRLFVAHGRPTGPTASAHDGLPRTQRAERAEDFPSSATRRAFLGDLAGALLGVPDVSDRLDLHAAQTGLQPWSEADSRGSG